jgi:NAD(P)-dependent dehydrogenase (short-subunit alcohol dehydrogenase family)
VDFLRADHATVAGNRQVAEQVRAAFPDLDVLVNNVGGLYGTRSTSGRPGCWGASCKPGPPSR